MDFATYLSERKKAEGLTLAAMARRLGIGVGHLHDIKSGRRLPKLVLALKIQAETKGSVTPNDFHQVDQPIERAA